MNNVHNVSFATNKATAEVIATRRVLIGTGISLGIILRAYVKQVLSMALTLN